MITKQTNDFSKCDFNSGEVILIDKPSGYTSFKVVSRIRKLTGAGKVGHSGTLDPIATGLLIICTGKSTKEMFKYQNLNKTYTGVITLGKSSPSMDTETEIKNHIIPLDVDEKKILKVRDRFLGEIYQTPPMYSAVKVKGRKLYKMAREGKTIDRTARSVRIDEFELVKIEMPEINFRIICSKGTYIRVIADDFGKYLGTGAILSSLRRIKIGEYSITDAITLNEFERNIEEIYDIDNHLKN